MTPHAPLIIDVAGTALQPADIPRLQHPLVGGVILFGRNWADRAALTQLCADIKAVRADLLICVDHEGGRVQRFKRDGFTHVPAMRALGELWDKVQGGDAPGAALRAMNAASACGYVLGAELRACGVDFTFAPILDLDYGNSEVIGDRAFSPSASVSTALAKSVMHGLLQAGMANCGIFKPCCARVCLMALATPSLPQACTSSSASSAAAKVCSAGRTASVTCLATSSAEGTASTK